MRRFRQAKDDYVTMHKIYKSGLAASHPALVSRDKTGTKQNKSPTQRRLIGASESSYRYEGCSTNLSNKMPMALEKVAYGLNFLIGTPTH